jgi:hypothetical protein
MLAYLIYLLESVSAGGDEGLAFSLWPGSLAFEAW